MHLIPSAPLFQLARAIVATAAVAMALWPGRANADAVALDLPGALARAANASPAVDRAKAIHDDSLALSDAASPLVVNPPSVQLTGGVRYLDADGSLRPELGIALWQPITITNVKGARERVASATVASEHAELSATRADAMAAAGLAWVDAAESRRAVEVRAAWVKKAAALLDVVEQRAEIGRAEPEEQAMASALLGRARAGQELAQGRYAAALTNLRYAAGVDGAVRVVGDLDTPLPFSDAAGGPRSTHPDVVRLAPLVEAARADAELARASAAPTMSIGPSVLREGTGDWVVLGQVQVPLPFSQPGAFAARRSEHDRIAAQARHREVSQRAVRDVMALRAQRDQARRAVATLDTAVIEPSQRALQIAEERFREGALALTALAPVQRTSIEAELERIEAKAQLLRLEIRLAHATGALSSL